MCVPPCTLSPECAALASWWASSGPSTSFTPLGQPGARSGGGSGGGAGGSGQQQVRVVGGLGGAAWPDTAQGGVGAGQASKEGVVAVGLPSLFDVSG